MLTELFKTEESVRILRFAIDANPFSVAEVSRATGANKGLVSRHLRFLEERGLVSKEGRKYSPKGGSLAQTVKLLLNFERIDLSALNTGYAKGLGLCGSWARGTNTRGSDLGLDKCRQSAPRERACKASERLSLHSGVEVNLLVLTPEKLERLKKEDLSRKCHV